MATEFIMVPVPRGPACSRWLAGPSPRLRGAYLGLRSIEYSGGQAPACEVPVTSKP